MSLEKRLDRLEGWADRQSGGDSDEALLRRAGIVLERLTTMELNYLVWLLPQARQGQGRALTEAEQQDLAHLLALAQGELSREQAPCRGEFTCLDYARGRWGFARCPECGRSHPAAPVPLPELPPFETWAHLLPEDHRSPSSVWKLGFYVRPGGEVVGYLRY